MSLVLFLYDALTSQDERGTDAYACAMSIIRLRVRASTAVHASQLSFWDARDN